jgi:hypothetical protein
VKVGVLVTGDSAVRGAHSLSPQPGVDEVVVIGPARSRNFRVVKSPEGCDLLLGTGPDAPARARELGVPLIWDGDEPEPGVLVWGASALGLALALGSREPEPSIVALAHPDQEEGQEHLVRFPDPIGSVTISEVELDGHHVSVAKSPNQFAACLALGTERKVTIIEDAAFLDGVALAAGAEVAEAGAPHAVWDRALPYLQTATAMGLVMGES